MPVFNGIKINNNIRISIINDWNTFVIYKK